MPAGCRAQMRTEAISFWKLGFSWALSSSLSSIAVFALNDFPAPCTQELRCLYLLSMVKDEVGQGAWDYARHGLSFGFATPCLGVAWHGSRALLRGSKHSPAAIFLHFGSQNSHLAWGVLLNQGEQNPELLTDIIRGSWSVSWDEVGNVKRLTRLLPKAFPRLS